MADSSGTTTGITNSATSATDASDGSWERMRVIIDSLVDGIVIVDHDGIIRFANPAAAALFNRTATELEGSALGTPLLAGETTEMEIVRRGGGEVVHAELRTVTTEWEGKEVELVSLRDVTDRKFGEERSRQLAHEREARLQAEAASRTKSDFLAIMSHELRTPLNAILGYSELIELGMSGLLTDEVRNQIGRIRGSAKHLTGLVNDILDLARVDAGRLQVVAAPANVSEAIDSALGLVAPQAATKRITLVVAPGADTLPPYIGDSERVRQILVNLLSNAVKCVDPGGSITIEGTVTKAAEPTVHLQPRHAHVRITVRDTGMGIPADKLVAIFEPFVQVDTGKARNQDGSGLGLAIAQRLARAMGGDITVESELGKGSSFHLWLPVDSGWEEVPADEIVPVEDASSRRWSRSVDPSINLKGLGEIACDILQGLSPLVDAVVARIRCDSAIPMAAGLRTSQVTDHLSTLIADVASALIVVEEEAGRPSPLLADAVEIQRLLAERHGAQRAILGWNEAALRREFMIIREEMERVVRAAMPADGIDPDDAIAAVNRFVDRAEYIGVRAMEKELAT